jgi:hypothetical protein
MCGASVPYQYDPIQGTRRDQLYTFDALTKLGIFIIRTGRIKLFKTLDFAVDPTNKKIVYEAFQGPDLNDYKRK